jgi:hypothetical protein
MDWFQILKAARDLHSNPDNPNPNNSFTAFDLNGKIKFPAGDNKLSHRLASAWICKLVAWGYVVRVGTQPNPGHKPVTLYALTEKGLTAKNTSYTAHTTAPSEEELSDFDELRYAVRGFETTRSARQAMGKKEKPKVLAEAEEKEEEAFAKLLALCDKFDKEEFGVE